MFSLDKIRENMKKNEIGLAKYASYSKDAIRDFDETSKN